MTIFAGIMLSWFLAIFNALLKKLTDWKDVAIFNTFAFFVVPLMLIVAAYIAIFFAAKKSLKEHRKRSLKKVSKGYLLLVKLFFTVWLNWGCLYPTRSPVHRLTLMPHSHQRLNMFKPI